MGLSTADRNRHKRERKKKERERQKKEEELSKQQQDQKPAVDENADVEIEYVTEAPMDFEASRRFQVLAGVVTDEENIHQSSSKVENDEELDESMSKRKLRETLRPSVAELKRRVKRPDLVEAHDITATDPDFLIELKAIPGTVGVPVHWGRKRKYLQGKRGFEKPPFKLPDFIVKTGITDVRDTVADQENDQSAKQKNRGRVAPKMGAIDIE
jgi:splicing factor 3B subunit 2